MTAVSEPLWEELHGNLRAFISRRVRNQSDVDDLVQRVLLQIVKGLGSVRDAERLHAWIYRTARNVIVDYYRSSTARREVASGGTEDLALADGADSQALSEGDERSALQELAACMTPMIASCLLRTGRRLGWRIWKALIRLRPPRESACRFRG
jgi:RNA polymerase sigma-70 factor, ECF subfamily